MVLVSRRLAHLVILIAGIVVSLGDLRAYPPYNFWCVAFCALVAAVIGCRPAGTRSLFIGLCIPFIPLLGRGALSTVVGVVLLSQALSCRRTEKESATESAHPVAAFWLGALCVFAVSAVKTFAIDVDLAVLNVFWERGGLIEFLRADQSAYRDALRFLFLWYLGFCILQEGIERDRFFRGFILGLSFSAVYFLGQLFIGTEFFSLTRGPFWAHVGRYSGAFSDPNAAGVFLALAIPALVWRSLRFRTPTPYFAASLVGLLIVQAIMSGSRTFWLGVFSWLILFGVLGKLPSRMRARLGMCCLVVGLLLAGILSFIPKSSLPIGLQRMSVLLSGSQSGGNEGFSSRIIFGRVAFQMWREHPAVGVGLSRFRDELHRTGRALGIEFSNWWDNANNFYLGVLAEQGAIGALLLAVCFIAGYRTLAADFGRMLILLIAVLLLTGPHFVFEEVLLLFCCLLAVFDGNANSSRIRRAPFALGLTLFAAFCLWTGLQERERSGFYRPEMLKDGVFLWSVDQAKLRTCGPVTLRAIHPDMQTRPVHVGIRGTSVKRELILSTPEWITVDTSNEVTRISVDRLWSPGGSDPRWLGIQLKAPTC